ncbi:MAG: dihydroorotate dehydrogenase electron transfer subunit, partial [Elusimicrobiota bacterium]|nr:dihydroorotate dehydrogenase electron transfer subunit [Elusimicrobiota bacterium]
MVKLFLDDVEVIENKFISPNHKLLVFKNAKIAKIALPGQFLTILTSKFLRRPFSIAAASSDKIEIIYKVVGEGTLELSHKIPGDKINVFGPLGDGIFNSSLITHHSSLIFIAGGTGIASLRLLAQKIHTSGILFYGVKTKSEIIGVDIFKQKHWKIKISTEDGSFGYKGMITELFNKYLISQSLNFSISHIYAAGPKPMLKEISHLSLKFNIPTEISLEEIIACGVGACRGCVIK